MGTLENALTCLEGKGGVYSQQSKCPEIYNTVPQNEDQPAPTARSPSRTTAQNVALRNGVLNDCLPRILLGPRQMFYSTYQIIKPGLAL